MIWRALLLGIAFAAATACTAGGNGGRGSPAASPSAEAPGATGATLLTIMEFNIEYGGDGIDFSKVVEAVERSDADVVAIEEAEGNTQLLAEQLGWPYFDSRRQLVSQLPLLPSEDEAVAFVELEPGKVAAIANVHLTSSPYGPNLIKNKDATLEQVLKNEERIRMPEIEPVLDSMNALTAQGYPAFIVGDFNTPSHRDWTREMVGERPHIEFAVEWPVTKAVEQAGFRDSFRDIHPDPKVEPGLTWPAWRPEIKGEWNPPKDAAEDRIDFIFAAGPAKAIDSWVMGETGADVHASVTPWPTDHRGVVSTFEVRSAPPPVLVAVDRKLYTAGDPVRAIYHTETDSGQRVAIVPEGGNPTDAVDEIATSGTDGTLEFDSSGWKPGAYDAVLLDADATTELSRTPFWVQEPGARPEIRTTKRAYRVGEPITVEWKNAPANRWDWVGIYKRGANPNVAWYLDWEYTGATVEGSLTFKRTSHGPWPLDPGAYSVYLLIDDGYKKVAESTFAVKG